MSQVPRSAWHAKPISICDELFPEMTQVFKDPTLPTALAIREHFPTPTTIATTTLSALAELRIKPSYPSNAQLHAPSTIGSFEHRDQGSRAATRSGFRARPVNSGTATAQ